MKRVWTYGACVLLSGLAAATVRADDWRPAAPRTANAGVSLGKPEKARTQAVSAPRQDDEFVTAHLSPLSGLNLQPTRLVVRGQNSDGAIRQVQGGPYPPAVIPGSPEEQYNCGVVSEGPPSGGLFSTPPSGWFSGIGSCFGNYTNFLSDHAFDGFVSPITNPFYFEDPRSLTELRPVFIYQSVPGGNPSLSNANVEMFALQARLALTDRWSLTLNKLGFIAAQSDGPFGDGSGLSELNFGVKYTFWRDDCVNKLMAIGLQAEFPIGSSGVAQDTGSGSLTPYFSYAQQFGGCWHFMASTGYRYRMDSERSDAFFLSAHIDYGFYNRIYPMLELTWWHSMKSGTNLPGGFEGQDLVNFGNANSSGKDIVTLAAGVRFKITEAAQFGIAFEMPIVDDHDFMDYRITADFILRY